jgi:hypothetical protein
MPMLPLQDAHASGQRVILQLVLRNRARFKAWLRVDHGAIHGLRLARGRTMTHPALNGKPAQ